MGAEIITGRPEPQRAYELPENRARKTLGKGVHPAALERLFEMFPNAAVAVEHESVLKELPEGEMKMGQRYYRNPERITRVFIDIDGDRAAFKRSRCGWVCGTAICHPEDNFDRRRGVDLAFRRAMRAARAMRRTS